MDEIQMDLQETEFLSSLMGSSSHPIFQNHNFLKPIFRIPKICTQPRRQNRALLSICGREGYLNLGYSLHASIFKNPEFFYLSNVNNNAQVVWNSLLSFYAKCGELHDAIKLFDQMPIKDTISWNSMISGFLRNDELELGFGYFKRMHRSDYYHFDRASLTSILSACDGPDLLCVNRMIHGLVFSSGFQGEISVSNALITSYYKCQCRSLGKQVFEEMSERNVITWTAMISGLAKSELYDESLRLLVRMHCGNAHPNFLTYLSSLSACSGLQALREGSQIHGLTWKLGIQSDFCIESALMDMYSKCGSVEAAWQIFESAEVLDKVS